MALNNELAEKNVVKEFRAFIKRCVQDFFISPCKKVQTHKTIFLVYKKLARNCKNGGCLGYSEFLKIFPIEVNCEYFIY